MGMGGSNFDIYNISRQIYENIFKILFISSENMGVWLFELKLIKLSFEDSSSVKYDYIETYL